MQLELLLAKLTPHASVYANEKALAGLAYSC